MPNPEIAPALVERMVKLVQATDEREERQCFFGPDRNRSFYAELRALKAELPKPVDADLLLAREIAAAEYGIYSGPAWEEGGHDDSIGCRAALAAIRRVRAEQQPARATTWQEEH